VRPFGREVQDKTCLAASWSELFASSAVDGSGVDILQTSRKSSWRWNPGW